MTDEKGRFLYKFAHDWPQKFIPAGVEDLLLSCSDVEKVLEGSGYVLFSSRSGRCKCFGSCICFRFVRCLVCVEHCVFQQLLSNAINCIGRG